MKVRIVRNPSSPTGTPGWLRTEEDFTCNTLELPYKNNKTGLSCIEAGTYFGRVEYHPHYKCNVIRLEDKNGRKGILIHNGNFAGDIEVDADHDKVPDYVSQVEGCIEVGAGYGLVERKDKKLQFGITKSKDTLARLTEHLGPGRHEFIIQWAEGWPPVTTEPPP